MSEGHTRRPVVGWAQGGDWRGCRDWLRSGMPFPIRCRPVVAFLAALAALPASDVLIDPGTTYSVLRTAHLKCLVPAEQAEALRPLAARAEAIYVHLAREAGYPIREPLVLWLSDEVDVHNGFSTPLPRPIVNVVLSPSLPASGIFVGADEFERTLVHELAHHMSNDRSYGFRRVLEGLFGRVLPSDPLSLLVFYLSTPAHLTMPSFWHEGLGQWAETEYAPAGSVWGGRGRDSLTHMVWRLDAAAEATPTADAWRPTYHRWPFGNRVYLYGAAYTRWLAGAYGKQASLWQLAESQAHQWALAFDEGIRPVVGRSHAELLSEARRDLLTEQAGQLARLRSQPVTAARRLTPIDTTIGAPAWLPDGRIVAAMNGPYDDPSLRTVAVDGRIRDFGPKAWGMGAMRPIAGAPGTYLRTELPAANDTYARARAEVVWHDGSATALPLERVIQADAAKDERVIGNKFGIDLVFAAVQLQQAGQQKLRIGFARAQRGPVFTSGHGSFVEVEVPVEGRPWSPAFRPGFRTNDIDFTPGLKPSGAAIIPRDLAEVSERDLIWVETDAGGSRLTKVTVVHAPRAVGTSLPTHGPDQLSFAGRTILASVKGRILHPNWSADGKFIYFCADHTGVANAYRVDPTQPDVLVPVTNTIGGVIACVPSPDGKSLAIVDHDHQGPFLATIPNDPATWPKTVPSLALAWPAPVPAQPVLPGGNGPRLEAGQPTPLPPKDGAVAPAAKPYHGLAEVRPLFWSPTLYPVPDGGLGIAGLAADPLFTHEFVGSVGYGPQQGSPVWLAAYTAAPWPVEMSVIAWQAERTYSNQAVDSNYHNHDYTESVRTVEGRLGYGLAGLRRRWQAYATYGSSMSRTISDGADPGSVNIAPAFTGREDYLEFTVAYDDSVLFPTSYAREDGDTLVLRARHSGLGGDRDGNLYSARGAKVVSVWPAQGHQLVLGGALGWSESSSPYLQGRFVIGGDPAMGYPRGYVKTEAAGDYQLAASFAYRLPLWRPFQGFSTTPFGFRQLTLEGFYDTAKVSSDRLNGNGGWWSSAGAELRGQWEIWTILTAPGLGFAHLYQHNGQISTYLTLDFTW